MSTRVRLGTRPPRAAVAGLVLALGLGCAEGGWDLAGLEERHRALTAVGSHRLGDARPYWLPAGGMLTLFLCRWPTAEAIPVSLPPDATREQRRILERALAAWEGAGLGVRFAVGRGLPRRGITLRFAEGDLPAPIAERAAGAWVDCALDPIALDASRGDVLPARLVFAEVRLRRSEPNAIGREIVYTPEQLAGSVLHELGHALGFQGHAKRGATVMVRSVDDVRRAGRRLMAGEPFRDATLRALYAVPSGSVVRRIRVTRRQTALVDRMAALAPQRGLAGPFARVGDRTALLHWRDDTGADYAVHVFALDESLRAPNRLALHANQRLAELLAGTSP